MKIKRTIIPISIITAILIIVLAFLIIRLREPSEPMGDTVPSTEFTKSQVMQHATTTDCWVAIGGSVYRLDNYFVKHPDELLSSQLCGKIEPEVTLPTNLKKSALLAYRLGILTP